MSLRVTVGGPTVEAVQHHHGTLPEQVPGQHLWICVAMYRVKPAISVEYHLDTENLLTIEGPGCYWCEEPWTEAVAKTPCVAL
mgnify:CR=1 FL=1